MLKLSKRYQIDRRILKCDYTRHNPIERSIIDTPSSQIYINIPTEDSVNSLTRNLLRLLFDVLHSAINNRYVDGNDIILVIPGPIALFNMYNFATSIGKRIEEISESHIVCLIFN